MDDPVVSVVIPTYNRADLLERAIQSVLGQTFENFEVVVVDDASEDDTKDVVEDIDDPRIEYIRHRTNRNGAVARNTGIDASTGEFVAFLDDDDEWYPSKLEKQLDAFEHAEDDVALVYCWSDIYAAGEKVNTRTPTLRGRIFDETLTRNPIGATSTLMVTRDALETIGGFDERLNRGQDSDLIRRITWNYAVDFVDETLVKRRSDHDAQQIMDQTADNLHASIECRKLTLSKFDDYLNEHPVTKAKIRLLNADMYAKTHEWHRCLWSCLLAFLAAPASREIHGELMDVARRAKFEAGI